MKKNEIKLWKPNKIGKVIAERKMELKRRGKKSRKVIVQFGCPIRASTAKKHDYWVCPIRITGLSSEFKTNIFGSDSLQALTLAMNLVDDILPLRAKSCGGKVIYLHPSEPLIFNQWSKKKTKQTKHKKLGKSKNR